MTEKSNPEEPAHKKNSDRVTVFNNLSLSHILGNAASTMDDGNYYDINKTSPEALLKESRSPDFSLGIGQLVRQEWIEHNCYRPTSVVRAVLELMVNSKPHSDLLTDEAIISKYNRTVSCFSPGNGPRGSKRKSYRCTTKIMGFDIRPAGKQNPHADASSDLFLIRFKAIDLTANNTESDPFVVVPWTNFAVPKDPEALRNQYGTLLSLYMARPMFVGYHNRAAGATEDTAVYGPNPFVTLSTLHDFLVNAREKGSQMNVWFDDCKIVDIPTHHA